MENAVLNKEVQNEHYTNKVSYKEQIDNIMANFDFRQVHAIMKALNWCWRNSTRCPSESKLRSEALRLLTEVQSDWRISCGGFTAFNDKGKLNLFFGIDSFIWTDDFD